MAGPAQCHDHSGFAAEIAHMRGDLGRIETKLDRLVDGIGDLDASARSHRQCDIATIEETCQRRRGEITTRIERVACSVEANATWQARLAWTVAGVATASGILGTLVRYGVITL